MKHHFNIFTMLIFVISAHSCAAMKLINPTNPPILAKIKAMKHPIDGVYLTNNSVIINGRNGCSIIDLRNGKEIKTINTKQFPKSSSFFPRLTVHPNRTKFALSHYNTITIYNAATGEIEHSIQQRLPILTSAFCPIDDTIYLSYLGSTHIKKYYYTENLASRIDCYNGRMEYGPIITCNPTRDEVCCALDTPEVMIHTFYTKLDLRYYKSQHSISTGNSGHKVYEYNSHDGSIISSTDNHNFCEYSPDGLTIVCGNEKKVCIIDANSYTEKYLPIDHNKDFVQAKFHPNGHVVATLSQRGTTVQYWDIKTLQLIHAEPSLSSENNNDKTLYYINEYYRSVFSNHPANESLSFSLDGERLLVTALTKCVEMAVPFEVIYQPDTKEKTLFAYWLLTNYQRNHNNEIPNDIIQLLIYNLFKTFKR